MTHPMHMQDTKTAALQLMVVGPSCIEAVNRAVYRLLVRSYRMRLHLVAPRWRRVGRETRACAPVGGEPFEATLLEPVGSHLRLERMKGLPDLIRLHRPAHVLVEADPASALTRQVIGATRACGGKASALTCENLERHYLRDAMSHLFCGRMRKAVGGVVTWWLWRSARAGLAHVLTISGDGTRCMSRLGFADRVRQIPLGFDPELFFEQNADQVASTRRRLGLNAPTIAYFGRLAPEKGVHLLLLALSRLREVSWQLLIDRFSTYDSAYSLRLQEDIARLDLGARVVHFDATHAEMPDYMNAADVVVLPSLSGPGFKEQYGRVLPEAMACGKIVVGSDCGAIPELIGDAGFVFPEGDVGALADLLRRLLAAGDHQLRSVQKRAKERALQKLSIVRQAEILESLFATC